MKAPAFYIVFLIAGWSTLLTSCSIRKKIPPGDKLYVGAKVQSTGDSLGQGYSKTLMDLVKPKPNKKILGFPYRLAIFNLFKEPRKSTSILYKLKYSVGQPPVLLSQVDSNANIRRVKAALFNKGWMQASVASQVDTTDSKASIKYIVDQGRRYRIGNVFFPPDTSIATKAILASANQSLLRQGDFLDIDLLKIERDRIDLALKEKGFYYFNPDHLLIRIDSTQLGKADLYLTLKPDITIGALVPWKLGNVSVYSNYSAEKDSIIRRAKPTDYKLFYYIDRLHIFRPQVFNDAVLFRKDSVYRRQKHSLTIERLMNLNSFRFVRIGFTPVSDSATPTLDTKVYLTPAVRQTVRMELSGNSKTNNHVGSEFSINYRNVNVFHGAEVFELRLSGGYDWQVGGKQLERNIQTILAEANLFVPKMLPRIGLRRKQNPYVPRTAFSTAIEYYRRPDLYDLRSLRFWVGYQRKDKKTMEHDLKLLYLNSIDPSHITPKFQQILSQDINLRASFERQFIIGSKYQFSYNNTYITDKSPTVAFTVNIGSSGSLAGLFLKSQGDTVGSKKLLGVPISQFFRIEPELRTYWRVQPKWTIASRLIFGFANAYGNSRAVPYAEQFFIGGSSSIRAFRARTLGPGSFHTTDKEFNANESGEIKIEANAEARLDVSRYIKLAFFMDAGNIWLRREAASEPGSGFGKDFLKQLAVGTGTGVRIDMQVMILRFDIAFPLRKPWYPEGRRWVFNEIDLGNSIWRKENLILNIGIGYPF